MVLPCFTHIITNHPQERCCFTRRSEPPKRASSWRPFHLAPAPCCSTGITGSLKHTAAAMGQSNVGKTMPFLPPMTGNGFYHL